MRIRQPVAALSEAMAALSGSGRALVVAGSLYLVGEVRRELTARYGVPKPAAETALFGDPEEGARGHAGLG